MILKDFNQIRPMLNMPIQIHPATRMLMVIWFSAILHFISLPVLLCTSLICIVLAALLHFQNYARLLRKTRVLLLMIGLVYAFSIPGEYVIADMPGWFSMSKEGLQHGAEQVVKMLVMLASLVMLLGTTPRGEVLSGIYTLLLPLRWMGWNPDKVIVRIYLTLDYAEHPHNDIRLNSLPAAFYAASEHHKGAAGQNEVQFEVKALHMLDWLLGAVMLLVLLMASI